MKRNVLVDTGPLVAFFNRRDPHHAWVELQLAEIEPPLITCEAVIAEACHLLKRFPAGPQALLQLITRGLLSLSFDLSTEAANVSRLITRYLEVPMDFADACLVRLAEIHTGSPILTLDSDFRIYRIHGRRVIPTLMPGMPG